MSYLGPMLLSLALGLAHSPQDSESDETREPSAQDPPTAETTTTDSSSDKSDKDPRLASVEFLESLDVVINPALDDQGTIGAMLKGRGAALAEVSTGAQKSTRFFRILKHRLRDRLEANCLNVRMAKSVKKFIWDRERQTIPLLAVDARASLGEDASLVVTLVFRVFLITWTETSGGSGARRQVDQCSLLYRDSARSTRQNVTADTVLREFEASIESLLKEELIPSLFDNDVLRPEGFTWSEVVPMIRPKTHGGAS